jgi:stage II sporulation protein D (peptidoglycan lytic transglycosylase)
MGVLRIERKSGLLYTTQTTLAKPHHSRMARQAQYAPLLLLALAGCARREVAPPTTTPPPARLTRPAVRVGIAVDTATVEVGSNRAFEIVTRNGDVLSRSEANERWTFRVEGDQLRARSSAGRELGPAASPLRIAARDSGYVSISGRNYRGTVLLRVAGEGSLTAINVVDIEEYLRGVVPYEIGRLAPQLIEAVKAQAVAARTYAIGNMNRWSAQGFDFVATVQDQVYGGVSGEDSVASRAVRETRGDIVTFEGRPIVAYYSSTCGGRTASIEDSWTWRSPVPYLKSVSDSIPGGGRAYCETSNRFRWTVNWTRAALRRVLEQSLTARLRRPVSIEKLEGVEITGRNASGRAEAVRIRFDGETASIPGDSIRWVLRPDSTRGLNSSLLFELNAHRENGEVSALDVRGGGWGHGVGMCQVGAIGRARAGQNYRDILGAYYSGTRVESLY